MKVGVKVEELFKKLNIKPKDLSLYEKAFSHSSYANEHKAKQDYERLEFLGDAVLDLVVSDYLYKKENLQEGQMTKIRASYVCTDANAFYAKDLGLEKYVKVGHGEEKKGKTIEKHIIADTFESLMGAIYLDLGYQTVRRVILSIVPKYIEDKNIMFFKDYKSVLQEYTQTSKKSLNYEIIKEEGPAHDKSFTVAVMIDEINYGEGSAKSKKSAEQEAARKALEKLAKNSEI